MFFSVLLTWAGVMLVGRPVHVPFIMAWYIVARDGCPIRLCSQRTSRAVFRSSAALLATGSAGSCGTTSVPMVRAERSGS